MKFHAQSRFNGLRIRKSIDNRGIGFKMDLRSNSEIRTNNILIPKV
jgi:hypothetical protein